MNHQNWNEYADIFDRLEPRLVKVENDAALASIAISLKRIAAAMEKTAQVALIGSAVRSANSL